MTWILASGYVLTVLAGLAGIVQSRDRLVIDALGLGEGSRRPLLDAVGAWTARWLSHRRLEERMTELGRPELLPRLLASKLLGAVAGTGLGLSAPVGMGRVGLAVLLAGGAWAAPEFTLARQVTRKREAQISAVPDLLDMMDVGVSAGLTARAALERAVDGSPEVLRPMLRAARERVALGDRWPGLLIELARRQRIPALGRLASALDRATRLGAPVDGALRALARDVRAERDARLEERAGRAPVAMLFPLVFCILPAFVLSAVLPAALVAIRDIQ